MSSLPKFLQFPSKDAHLNTIFRELMAPLYLNSWVHGWVFQDITTSLFHQHHLLSPQVFRQLLLFLIEIRYQDSLASTFFHGKCEGHLAFIPTRSFDQITVGHAICFTSDFKSNVLAEHRLPFSPPYIGRFVLDHIPNRLLLFIPCTEQNLITIHCFDINTQQLSTFIIPAKDYDWFHLPDDPRIVLKGWLTPPTNTNTLLQPQKSLTLDDLNDLMKSMCISTTVSDFPNQTTQSLTLNNMIPANVSNSTSTETEISHLLSPEQLFAFRDDLVKILHNNTCSVGKRVDRFPYVITGYNAMIGVPNLHALMYLSNSQIASDVGHKCALVYYSAVLSVSTDAPLLRKSPPTKYKPLIPFPSATTNTQSKLTEESKKPVKKSRQVILHERKIRNRLSAARSNARKQQHVETIEKALHESRIMVQQLRERKRFLLKTNLDLRMLVHSQYDDSIFG